MDPLGRLGRQQLVPVASCQSRHLPQARCMKRAMMGIIGLRVLAVGGYFKSCVAKYLTPWKLQYLGMIRSCRT